MGNSLRPLKKLNETSPRNKTTFSKKRNTLLNGKGAKKTSSKAKLILQDFSDMNSTFNTEHEVPSLSKLPFFGKMLDS